MSRATTTVCGIDPGLRGGLAACVDGRVVEAIPMPTRKVCSAGARVLEQVDGAAVADWVASWCPDAVYVEDAFGRKGDGVGGSFTFGGGWWVLVDRIRHPEPAIITPRQWQRGLLGPWLARVAAHRERPDGTIAALTNRDRNKAASVLMAKELAPEIDLCPGRKTSPHDGISDAIGIAIYASIDYPSRALGAVPGPRPRAVRRGARNRRRA